MVFLYAFVYFLVWWANGFPAIRLGTDWYFWFLVILFSAAVAYGRWFERTRAKSS